MPRRVILDCDPGTDDAVAIMLAALHPDLDLRGVCTVFGNHPVTMTTDHALRVLDHVGHGDVPVHPGAGGPSAERPVAPDDRDLPALALPATHLAAAGEPAAEWLAAVLGAGATTLVATGPLTNLARALRIEPGIAEVVEEVVVLGGTDRVPSVTPLAERNVWNDPVALSVVLSAGFRRLVMVTLDATHRAQLDSDDVRALRDLGTPAGTATAQLVGERIRQHALSEGPPSAPVHDAVAVAYLVDPDVVALQPMHVAVDLAAGPSYARTSFRKPGEPNAWVAHDAERDRFVDLLLRAFSG